jgi:hypothetical protein
MLLQRHWDKEDRHEYQDIFSTTTCRANFDVPMQLHQKQMRTKEPKTENVLLKSESRLLSIRQGAASLARVVLLLAHCFHLQPEVMVEEKTPGPSICLVPAK